jgi:hypothetical protein
MACFSGGNEFTERDTETIGKPLGYFETEPYLSEFNRTYVGSVNPCAPRKLFLREPGCQACFSNGVPKLSANICHIGDATVL